MSSKIDKALDRLNAILPLPGNQKNCDPAIRRLHQHILPSFVEKGRISCCADSLCTEMIFLKDGDTANRWLEQDPQNKETFDLQEAIEFSDRFFSPLMS